MNEVITECEFALFLDLVKGHSIHYGFNHPAVTGCHDDIIRLHPKWHPLLTPDFLISNNTILHVLKDTRQRVYVDVTVYTCNH